MEGASEAAFGVCATDGLVDDGVAVVLSGVGGAGDDRQVVVGADGCGGAGVVGVRVGEQEMGGDAVTGEVEEFLDEGVGAASKASVDGGEAVVFEFDGEDVAGSGAIQPPGARDDALCHECHSEPTAMSVRTFE